MRKILVVRHAIAMDRVEAAKMNIADSERPLTKDGWRKMKEIGDALSHWITDMHIVATSPWLRAVQTSEIIVNTFDSAKIKETELLLPGHSHGDLLAWLNELPDKRTLAIVGHEPMLSEWVGWALTGKDTSLFSLKKGGACMIGFENKFEAGHATLDWLMTSAQLRRSGH